MIELRDITVRYAGLPTPALSEASLMIPSEQTTVLLGGSGSGKSTILRAILRLVALERGQILMDNAPIELLDKNTFRRCIGTVFQGESLFPHLTVQDNIALPLRVVGTAQRQRRTQADEMLALVGLEPSVYSHRFVHELSGGQKQRVSVARALVTQPKYLLMDEPFGALDAITRRKLQEEVKRWRELMAVTILFVTHDIMEAANLGDHIAVMDVGKLIQVGTIGSVMEQPVNDIVYQLVTKPLQELATFVKDSVA